MAACTCYSSTGEAETGNLCVPDQASIQSEFWNSQGLYRETRLTKQTNKQTNNFLKPAFPKSKAQFKQYGRFRRTVRPMLPSRGEIRDDFFFPFHQGHRHSTASIE